MDYENDPGWRYLRLPLSETLAASTTDFEGKKMIWVADPDEGYVMAEVKSTKGDDVVAQSVTGKEVKLKKDQIQDVNPPKFDRSEDMSTLSYLNDASVLENLRSRYKTMLIYTYSGLFCVVINPYKRLPIYTESVSAIYMGKRRNEVPPHLFAVSDEAYRNMLQDRENQSMLITGESGAGKTENTKKVISYFAMVGASQAKEDADKAPPADGEKKVSLEDKIVRTNPVLEAYGNAKTVRNNNSSRFGKFIRIHFNKEGRVSGCDIEHYLLEKSRVIKQAPGERCYHVFYFLITNAIPGMTDRLQIDKNISEYRFVNQAELIVDGIDDSEEMQLMDESYDIMGFTQQQKDEQYKICSAIMHMGQMDFKQRPREEQAEPDGNDEAIKCCAMYDCNPDDFLKSICKPRVRVGNEWVNKGQNLEQVCWSIGAMAKGIYARMFHWIVNRCNETLDAKVLKREMFIGVLDIAGFEIFDFNSFEQLWINFVNEKLQQFFNHHMFVLEQEEYAREGIQWVFIDFGLDLAACIELIEKPMGVISMLDEECVVPKGSDDGLASKLNDQHLGKHPNFQKPKPPKGKQAPAHFVLGHYAGLVRYNTMMWLEKNKDPLNDTTVGVLKATKDNELMKAIWADYTTQEEAAKKAKEEGGGGGGGKKKGKSAAFATVSMLYRQSLNNLMSMLHTTHPHFIRCLIPNEKKQSGMIDAALVLNQLTCNGVLEGIRICRKGFPNRMLHSDFKQRYAILAADAAKSNDDPTAAANAMAAQIEKDEVLNAELYRMGATKVFFKAGVLAQLEEARDIRLSTLLKGLQAQIRWHLAIKEVASRKAQMAGYTILQKNIRSWVTLRTWIWFKLFGMVKPLLTAGKEEEERLAREAAEKEAAENEKLRKEQEKYKEIEDQIAKLTEEKNQLFTELQAEKEAHGNADENTKNMEAKKKDLERQLADMSDQVEDQENKTSNVQREKKKLESEVDNLKKSIQDLELGLKKGESEKGSKDHQIKNLQDEMTSAEEAQAKLHKEKKGLEETIRKLTDDLAGEEDKVNHLNKVKSKLESSLDDMENSLEREKRQRGDIERTKRKVEGESKMTLEQVDELQRMKNDLENNIKKREQELSTMNNKLEDEQSLVAKLQRQIKEQQQRCEEVEEEVDAERQARSKSERARSDAVRELEELSERLDEAGGATAAQIEANKKREAELSNLRRQLEEANTLHETAIGGLRKKHNDAINELGEQLDQMQKQKAKLDKDKTVAQRDQADLGNQVEEEGRHRQEFERRCKTLEMQLADSEAKAEDQSRTMNDFANIKNKLTNEANELSRQLEDAESQINLLSRAKQQLQSQFEEAKGSADDESRDKQNIAGRMRNLEHEVDTLKEQVDDEQEAKAELQRQVTKANADAQAWRSRFEGEGLVKGEELEEAKRKLVAKLKDYQDSLDQANAKNAALEKVRQKLVGDLDDAQIDCERANNYANSLDKKQKNFDRVIDEWRSKNDAVAQELDSVQADLRRASTDAFKHKNAAEEAHDALEATRRDAKILSEEIRDLTAQLSDGGRSSHEIQKQNRRLEGEKEELQSALAEVEAALEAEESKVLRSQVEVQQIRSEIDKRVKDKEEDFENTRRNHQRAVESMQTTLDNEVKGKNDLIRQKRKLETDINDLEINLDNANKSSAEASRHIRKLQDQIQEMQMTIEEGERKQNDLREQYYTSEKRCTILNSEKEEHMSSLDNAERSRKQAEYEAAEGRTQINELSAQVSSFSAAKRTLEGELAAIKSELDDSLNELKSAQDGQRHAVADATKFAEDLRHEKDANANLDRMRKNLEAQVKDLTIRCEDAEAAASKGGKKSIARLEQRVHELEVELENEIKRTGDVHRESNKNSRRVKELEFQCAEEKRGQDRLVELIDQLQSKLKTYKDQLDASEELANSNLQKYRQLQFQLEEADERADQAETQLTKARAQSRLTVSASARGLATSKSGYF